VPDSFIAVDLGASSGRVMLGRLAGGRLALSEAHRFENGPLEEGGSLRWDVARLEREIRSGIACAREAADGDLGGVGVDSWGVDYVLLGETGEPVAPPHHYRDARTEGVMARVGERLGREYIFSRTGIQFVPFNTIYQLAAESAERLARAERLLLMADYFAHRLGGAPCGEVTLASTSQLLDPHARVWDAELAAKIEVENLPALLPGLVEAGARTGEASGVPVFATAAHDTAAAVAGCPASGENWAFLSSGTWSVLGVELAGPVLTGAALAANLSNELGTGGTVRLLKNIMGLWLLQECREAWSAADRRYAWDELATLAERAAPLAAVIDPDDARFFAPGDMPGRIDGFCRETGQTRPEGPGATARVVLEALALKTRLVLGELERVTGRSLETIHMIGGGVQNELLCQWTADATGRRVLAGPVEATAAGNVLVQAVGAGALASREEARAVVARSFDLVEYEPHSPRAWDEAAGRLEELVRRGRGESA